MSKPGPRIIVWIKPDTQRDRIKKRSIGVANRFLFWKPLVLLYAINSNECLLMGMKSMVQSVQEDTLKMRFE